MDVRMMSAAELGVELGRRIQAERLRQNLTQQTLADRAGLSRPTVARMETEGSTTLTNFLAALVALRRSGDLQDLLQSPPAATIEQFLGEQPTRKRGSR